LSEKALVITGLTKRYPGVVALDSVSLEVDRGEYFAVIGPSGSGKSTLLKCIAGLERPDSGSVHIFGRRVDGLPPEERGVGLIFQEIYLFPHMSARGNVVYAALARGVARAEDVAREALSALSVEVRMGSLPRELSLGEQQKVSLARALASGARLLLMDEPYGSMDPRTAAQLRYEVRRLAKSLGLTVVHVTHNQEEAMAIADRVAVMRRGRVEQVGSPLELYLRPKSIFVARFVGGENNFLEGEAVGCTGAYTELDIGMCVVRAFGEVKSGRAVIAVRPEKLRFSNEGFLEGRVEAREFLGKVYKYSVRLKDGRTVIVKSRVKVEPGASVKLSFDPYDAVVFPYPPEGLEEAVRYE
jgi:ABC-type Fe3+/spermidine/putrescine transport system ATPase subunit